MTDVIWDQAALTRLLNGPNGAVARDLARRAIRVESAAKILASHTPPSLPGSGPAVRTGRLRASISWRLGEDAVGLYAAIGSGVEYAAYVELGTERAAARPYLKPSLQAAR